MRTRNGVGVAQRTIWGLPATAPSADRIVKILVLDCADKEPFGLWFPSKSPTRSHAAFLGSCLSCFEMGTFIWENYAPCHEMLLPRVAEDRMRHMTLAADSNRSECDQDLMSQTRNGKMEVLRLYVSVSSFRVRRALGSHCLINETRGRAPTTNRSHRVLA